MLSSVHYSLTEVKYIIPLDIRTGEWKYRVEGYEPGGKWLAVAFSFKTVDRAFLITVFAVESRGRRTQ